MKGFHNRDRGFTLIEVLVALALMAMIATILVTSLQIGGHAWQRVTRTANNVEDIAHTQRVLRQFLSTLYPYERTGADATRSAFLVSDGASLEFSAIAPRSLADGMLRYQIAMSTESNTLAIRSRPDRNGPSPNGASDWATEPLLNHIAALAVQFLLKSDGGTLRWVDRWSESNPLPLLIRIDVTFKDSDSRRWPPLYIEPRVNTAVTCAFDVVSRRCRGET